MRLILAAAIAAVPVLAHADPMEDALEARHGFMKMLSINMGQLSGMAKGEIEYDAEAATTAASNIQALSGYDLPALFLDGTANGQMDDSDALPAIWEDSADFAAKYAALGEAATAAAGAVGGGAESIGPALQQLGGACKACHDKYRAD